MNKSRAENKIGVAVIVVLLVVTIFFTGLTGCQKSTKTPHYGKSTISYISESSKKTYLNSYDIDTQEEIRYCVGNRKDVFDFLFDIYDGGCVAASNTYEVFVLDSTGILRYPDIIDRIVAIKKAGNNIVLISQIDMETMKIVIYNSDFTQQLYSEEIQGYYSQYSLITRERELIFASYNSQLQTSSLHVLSLKNDVRSSERREYPLLDIAATMVPIKTDDELYIYLNQRILDSKSSIVIGSLFRVEEDSVLTKITQFDKLLTCGWYSDSELYLLLGLNRTELYLCSLDSFEEELLFTSEDNETITRSYELSGLRYLVSDKGVFLLKNKSVMKLRSWESFLYNNYN
ncbi:MAG: hypothetical protein FWF88_12465 [Peptococcaceae bacterium]|nr:hypothetical protein [Peptococcaceae bacterium]